MTTILGSLAIQIGNRIRTTEGTERNPNRREDLLRITALVTADGLDNPDRPPEPVAQVRVLPGALLMSDFSTAGGLFSAGCAAAIGAFRRQGGVETPDIAHTSGALGSSLLVPGRGNEAWVAAVH